MKKSGFIFSSLAFVFAVAAAATPVDFFTNSTKYPIVGGCSAAFQTVEANCLSTNHGAQCHVFVSPSDKSRAAFDVSICTSPLNIP